MTDFDPNNHWHKRRYPYTLSSINILQQEADRLGYALIPKDRIKTILTTCDMACHGDNLDPNVIEYTERYLLDTTAREIVNKLEEHKKFIIRRLSYDKWNDTVQMIAKFDMIVPKTCAD